MDENKWRFNYIKELAIKHMVRDETSRHGHKILWARLVSEFNEDIDGITIDRDIAQNILFGQTDIEALIFEKYDKDKVEKIPEGEFEIKSRKVNARKVEHLQVYSQLAPSVKKSPEYIMDTLGYPTKAWKLMDFKESNYGSLENPLYAYGIKVKPKTIKDLTTADSVEALNKITHFVKPFEPYADTIGDSDEMVIVHITDTHIGQDVSYARLLPKSVEKAVERAYNTGAEKVVLAFTGDIIHVDNKAETTARGTQLKTEGTAFDMMVDAYNILEETITRAAKIMPIDVYWVQGNHSRTLEGSIFEGLSRIYRDVDHIKWDVDGSLRKAFLYGKTLIGLEHNDAPKKTRFTWLPYEYSKLWGQAEHYEILAGHEHAESTINDTGGGLESNGKQVYRIGRAFTGRDEYSYSMRYQEMLPRIATYTYDKNFGFVGMSYI